MRAVHFLEKGILKVMFHVDVEDWWGGLRGIFNGGVNGLLMMTGAS